MDQQSDVQPRDDVGVDVAVTEWSKRRRWMEMGMQWG